MEDAFEFAQTFNVSGIHIAPMQKRSEILALLRQVAQLHPRTVVEIGTARGGTLFLLTRVAERDATIVSVDFPGGQFGGGYTPRRRFLYRQFARPGQELRLILADSHASATRAMVDEAVSGSIDFLLVDGDHGYDGVRRDFELYAPLVRPGGLIAFHDIVPGPVELVGGVPQFWTEIRGPDSQELVERWDQGGYGIGVLPR